MALLPLSALMSKYSEGLDGLRTTLINSFLVEYGRTVGPYARKLSQEDTVDLIKEQCGGDSDAVYQVI